ncbi:MAG: HAD family hydrolase [Methanobacteriota archaeon]|nr:MAG: HAD family hydrolase [Euryarchaeota archaeon]
MDKSLDGIRVVFLDLDGTIYLGDNLIDGSLEFLNRCEKKGIQRFFLSNNSSKSVTEYLAKLHGLGIPAEANDVLLSTHDLLSWLGNEEVTETFLVGTEPQYVVLGYDTQIDYEKLATASIHLHNKVPLVASHPDMVCPSPDGELPDVGAYLALFKATTGVEPTHICGKPNAGMILHKIEELDLQPSQCAMVGDRLYTDMEMAERAGAVGVLVLSGEATLDDLETALQTPAVVVNSVAELL